MELFDETGETSPKASLKIAQGDAIFPAEQGTVLGRSEQFCAQVPVRQMLQDYQQHMRGVDLMDQAVSYYTINHMTLIIDVVIFKQLEMTSWRKDIL